MHQINNKITIAVDAMGGENAPISVIKAIKHHKNSNIHFLICGKKEVLLPLLDKNEVSGQNYEIIDCATVVLDTDKPTEALKGKKDSSMRAAIEQVHLKKADACVSAGNTGTLMFTSRMVLGAINGIKRPAIVGLFPKRSGGKIVMLDLGANTTCNEIALSQFALMGIQFAKIVLHKEKPKVGILNVGVEHYKGRELEQKTHALLTSTIPDDFIGYVEPNEVVNGKADVIVTDGFSGNILLKAKEGLAKLFLEQVSEAFSKNILTKACGVTMKPYLKKQIDFLDPRKNNGAMFIGINGVVVKSHGNSDDIAFSNAISVAENLVRNNVNDQIISGMSSIHFDNENKSEILTKIKETSARIFKMKSD